MIVAFLAKQSILLLIMLMIDTVLEKSGKFDLPLVPKTKLPTWGNKFKPIVGRRQPNPPGSAKLWPFPRYPNKEIAPYPEILDLPVPLSTGITELDRGILKLHGHYTKIAKFRYAIYQRSGKVSKTPLAEMEVAEKLWKKHDAVRMEVSKLWDELDFLPEPKWFDSRKFKKTGILGAFGTGFALTTSSKQHMVPKSIL